MATMTRAIILCVLMFVQTACAQSYKDDDIDLRADKNKIEHQLRAVATPGSQMKSIHQYFADKGLREQLSNYPGSGNRLIKVVLGTYTAMYKAVFPVTVDVIAYLRFDHDDRLIDLWVQKETDAP